MNILQEGSRQTCSHYSFFYLHIHIAIFFLDCSNNGNLQFLGGSDPTEDLAVVEMCLFGEWRPLCGDSSWGDEEAGVICHQLGLKSVG